MDPGRLAVGEQGTADLVPPRERSESDAKEESGRGRDCAGTSSVCDRAKESGRDIFAEDGGGRDELEVRRGRPRHARYFRRPDRENERCCRCDIWLSVLASSELCRVKKSMKVGPMTRRRAMQRCVQLASGCEA